MKLKLKEKEIEFNLDSLEPFVVANELKHIECKVCPDKFQQICLQTTYRCNLACKYCFVNEYSHNIMPDMKIETAVEAIEKYGRKDCGISFFGGEPLLNWDLMFQVIEKYPNKRFSLTSNLTNLTIEMIEKMKNHGFSFIVSMDGDEKTHNKSRPHKKEENSYQMTLENLELMHEIYGKTLPVTLRATFAKDMDVNILDRIKHLNTFVEQGIVRHVSVEPATGSPEFQQENFTKQDKDFFQEQYYGIAEYFLSYFREKGRFPRFHHFNYPIQKTLITGNKKLTECGAAKGYISIATNGDIYPCHREETIKIGNIKTGIDTKEQEKWLENRYTSKEKCNKCWCKNFCGGGCRANAYIAHKDIQKPSETDCWFFQARIKAVLWLWSNLSKPEKLFLEFLNKKNVRGGK